MSEINCFLERVKTGAAELKFEEVIDLIDRHYSFEPVSFKNGSQKNAVGENTGSCKVLNFAKLHNLPQSQALSLFAQYYRDVLAMPSGNDHQNIRQFMVHGYDGLLFDGQPLCLKSDVENTNI